MLAALVTALAMASSAVAARPRSAEPGVQPPGAVALPDGPAQAWLLADLDSGRILASHDPYAQHAPASTIKPLLAMVVLDNLRPDNFARANQSHTEVECSCVGLEPGQPYTTRQLLAALLMVSGNDAANMLADMLGGQQVAVAAMNRKAADRGRPQHKGVVAVGARRAGLGVDHHAARPRGDLPRGLDLPADRPDHPGSGRHSFPARRSAPERAADPLSRHDRGQDRVHQPRPHTRSSPPLQRGNRRLVVVEMYGQGDLYGQAIGLFDWGFASPEPHDGT